MERWGLLERRAELLARKHTIAAQLNRLADVVVVVRKKEINDITITLKAIDLAIAYRDSERAKERYERIYQLQMAILGPNLFHEGEDDAEDERAAAEAVAEVNAIAATEREEGWQILLANMY
jgi:hypothetical protein